MWHLVILRWLTDSFWPDNSHTVTEIARRNKAVSSTNNRMSIGQQRPNFITVIVGRGNVLVVVRHAVYDWFVLTTAICLTDLVSSLDVPH